MKTFWRFFRYLKSYLRPLTLANVMMILFVVFSLLSVALIMPFINLLFNPQSSSDTGKIIQSHPSFSIFNLKEFATYKFLEFSSHYTKVQLVVFVCVTTVIVYFLKNLVSYLQTYFMSTVEQGVIKDIRFDLYSHFHKLSLSFFTEERKGMLISRIINDVQIIKDSMIAVINSLFRDPTVIVIFSIVLFILNWKLTLLIFLLAPITGFILAKIGNSLKRRSIRSQEKIADITSILDETFGAMRIVKAFGMEKYEIKRFGDEESKYFSLLTSLARRRALAGPITEFISIIAVVVILYFVGVETVTGKSDMSPGAFFAYLVLFFQMTPSLKLFGQVFNSIKEGIAASERVFGVLDTQPKVVDAPNAITVNEFTDKIEFKDVTFCYEGGVPVLKNIDLTVKKGEIVAIVGRSGAGKSSLVDLIPRFYDADQGCIHLDGIDIRQIKASSLRKLMGVVSQDTILFNDTVRNNIAYGIGETPIETIKQAAEAANAHEFISKFPNGYNTVIGDRGLRLSGGERQRIAIARALLKNPPILILDEATSSLDTESELLVQQAIENLMRGRTSVVIAHRLSTVRNANNIMVLSDGQIVEQGNHQKLMKTHGLYYKLYKMQFRDE